MVILQNFIINKNFNLHKILITFILIVPIGLTGQIEKQVRDDSPGLFKNHRLYHMPPKPLFKGRSHNLDFITDIPDDSVLSANFFFKTNKMNYSQEFSLEGRHGLYRFIYNPELYPGTHLEYYFILKTATEIHGAPINDKGELTPIIKLLIDPIEYFKQKKRLNQ